MKYCVLGAGLMGRAITHDLFMQPDTTSVLLVDNNVEALYAMPLHNNHKLQTKIIDVGNITQLEEIFKDINCAIGAVHYKFNKKFTNVDAQLKLDNKAKKASVSIIPDCGLAPGFVSILVRWGIEKFLWPDTVKIRVGVLPQNPKNEQPRRKQRGIRTASAA